MDRTSRGLSITAMICAGIAFFIGVLGGFQPYMGILRVSGLTLLVMALLLALLGLSFGLSSKEENEKQ